jgi:hypothetical protein
VDPRRKKIALLSARCREVVVAPEMLVSSAEQVSAEALALPVHAYTGHAEAVAASIKLQSCR